MPKAQAITAEMVPTVSIIIPAHNEANVIDHCLSGLLADSEPGEFDIVVVCNGCSDETAKIAASFGSRVRVFDLITASKVAALNFGDQAARTYPRVYLDSDLVISGSDIRSLEKPANRTRRLAGPCSPTKSRPPVSIQRP